MNKQQIQVIVGGLAIAVAVSCLGFFFGIKPQLDNKADFEAETRAAEAQTAVLNTQIAELQGKQENMAAAQAEYDVLAKNFPEDFEINAWIDTVLAAADRTGVTLETLTPTAPAFGTGAFGAENEQAAQPTPGNVNETGAAVEGESLGEGGVYAVTGGDVAFSSVEIQARGSAGALRSFVAALGGLDRPLLVDSMTLDAKANPSTVQLAGRTFLMRALTPPQAAPQ